MKYLFNYLVNKVPNFLSLPMTQAIMQFKISQIAIMQFFSTFYMFSTYTNHILAICFIKKCTHTRPADIFQANLFSGIFLFVL